MDGGAISGKRALWALFVIFFKAGTFTFAGGLAMLPVIEKDIVKKYRLMPEEDFLEYATLAQTLPGVIALNCACFVGRRAAGVPGMLVAAVGSTLSAFVLMLAATVALQHLPQSGPVAGALRGVRAASAALVTAAAVSLGRHNIKDIFSVCVATACFALVVWVNLSAPLIVLLAGAAGYAFSRIRSRGGHAK